MKPSEVFKAELVKRGRKKFNFFQKQFSEFMDNFTSYFEIELDDHDMEMIKTLADVTTKRGSKTDVCSWSLELAKQSLTRDEYQRLLALLSRMTIAPSTTKVLPAAASIAMGDVVSETLSDFIQLHIADPSELDNSDLPFYMVNLQQQYDFIRRGRHGFSRIDVNVHSTAPEFIDKYFFIKESRDKLVDLAANTNSSKEATSDCVLVIDDAITMMRNQGVPENIINSLCYNEWGIITRGMVWSIIDEYNKPNPGYYVDPVLNYVRAKYPELFSGAHTSIFADKLSVDGYEPGLHIPIPENDPNHDFFLGVIIGSDGPRTIETVTHNGEEITVLTEF